MLRISSLMMLVGLIGCVETEADLDTESAALNTVDEQGAYEPIEEKSVLEFEVAPAVARSSSTA